MNYKTVMLSSGKHTSPEHGVCVMELASMIAGEPFTDRPRSVSPVIAAILRNYNDWVDTDRRQGLYAIAATVVGTAAGDAIERERVSHCLRWSARCRPRRDRLGRLLHLRPLKVDGATPECVARLVLKSAGCRTTESHEAVLELVAELCEIGTPAAGSRPPVHAEQIAAQTG